MTPEKIVENHKKYVLQSWSKQGNLNPIPVAKADGIYFYDFDGNRYTDMTPMFYDRLEVKKLILAVDDISLLESIYNENLKKLEVYDRDNGTDYMSFLRLYLKYDGSVQRVAQETFVHRNTINYQLAKIKKIPVNKKEPIQKVSILLWCG